jgi:hypothetical protein
MYSSKNPKISQYTRRQIYNFYSKKEPLMNKKQQLIGYKKVYTQSKLAQLFGISRQTVFKIIYNGKKGDFGIKKPVNKRYLNFRSFSPKIRPNNKKRRMKTPLYSYLIDKNGYYI